MTVLTAAHEALRSAVAGIAGDQWQLSTPCDEWTVTQVLQHAAGDQLGYAAILTGGPGPDGDPFDPSGTITGDPVAYLEAALTASAEAFRGVTPDAEAVPNPLPQGPMPGWLVIGACALDAGVHAWDIAVATGQPSPLSDQVAAELLPVARQIVEPLRQWGAYAPALASDVDGDLAALLAYLGRRPGWSR